LPSAVEAPPAPAPAVAAGPPSFNDEQLKKLQKEKAMLEKQLGLVSEECDRLQDLVDKMEADAAFLTDKGMQSKVGEASDHEATQAMTARVAEAEKRAEEAEAERQQILELLEAAEAHIQELMRQRRSLQT
jgi:hypothetical protein